MPANEKNVVNLKTIQVSTKCYEEFNRTKDQLEKIFRKSISSDKFLRFLLFAKIDYSDLAIITQEKNDGEPFKKEEKTLD